MTGGVRLRRAHAIVVSNGRILPERGSHRRVGHAAAVRAAHLPLQLDDRQLEVSRRRAVYNDGLVVVPVRAGGAGNSRLSVELNAIGVGRQTERIVSVLVGIGELCGAGPAGWTDPDGRGGHDAAAVSANDAAERATEADQHDVMLQIRAPDDDVLLGVRDVAAAGRRRDPQVVGSRGE